METKTPRELQVDKIQAIKADLRKCRKNTPHWRDLNRHLQKEQKQLIMYDILRNKGGTKSGRRTQNA